MIVQFIHLILLCYVCSEYAGYASKMPFFCLAIWFFISFLILFHWLPSYTQKIINGKKLPGFFKTYNIFCFIIVFWVSMLFVFVNPLSFLSKTALGNSSALTISFSMFLYLLFLKPFMLALYEMLTPILPDEETAEDFLRARQTVPIIFFPPVLIWLIFEDFGLNQGMELMSEIKTLTLAPIFLIGLYVLSPRLFNWAWRTKNAKTDLVIRLYELSKKAQTKIAGVKVWNTFNEPLPNAAVAGIISKYRFVYITDFLLNIFNYEQIEAVVGHELGHLKLGHVVTYLLFSINAVLIAVILKSFIIIYIPYFYIHTEITNTLEILLFVPLFAVIFTALARHCETQADIFSAIITSKEKFYSSMNVIGLMLGSKPKWFPKWLLTHPETEDRIKNVKNYSNLEISTLIKSSKVLKYTMLVLVFVLVLCAIYPVSIVFKWSNIYNANQAGNCKLAINLCNVLPEWLQEHPFVLEQKAKIALNSRNIASAIYFAFKAYFGVDLNSVLEIPHHSGSPEVAFDFKVMQLILKFFNFR